MYVCIYMDLKIPILGRGETIGLEQVLCSILLANKAHLQLHPGCAAACCKSFVNYSVVTRQL